MKKEKFELGSFQRLWVETLRKYPERQSTHYLGEVDSDGEVEEACCLGQALVCWWEFNGTPIVPGSIQDGDSDKYLQGTYEKMGFKSPYGKLDIAISSSQKLYSSLAAANDFGVTWPEIADFVDSNPEAVFTKPV